MSDATLTRLIRPTRAHNSLYLNRQNVKNYLWLVALLPLLSGCESQAILVKKDERILCATNHRSAASGRRACRGRV